MKFWEAMKALDEGKHVRCKEWEERERTALVGIKILDNLWSFINKEWEVCDETKYVGIQEVVEGLKSEKKFSRKTWEITRHDYRPSLKFLGGSSENILSIEDFFATDWYEVK